MKLLHGEELRARWAIRLPKGHRELDRRPRPRLDLAATAITKRAELGRCESRAMLLGEGPSLHVRVVVLDAQERALVEARMRIDRLAGDGDDDALRRDP